MNIFYLHEDPQVSAKMHCDKHVVKMIIEYAQMLSTAHRMLDGKVVKKPSVSGKTMVKHYDLYEGMDDLESEMTYYRGMCISITHVQFGLENQIKTIYICIDYFVNYVMSIHTDMVRYTKQILNLGLHSGHYL